MKLFLRDEEIFREKNFMMFFKIPCNLNDIMNIEYS